MASVRRLSAIMFTDLVGFTKLGQDDEESALRIRKEHQSLLRPLFARHGGREVKSMGDGFLVEFASALDSVRCALEIQTVLARRNAGLDVSERIQLRIGLHVGDIVRDGDDVVGDAVNVASRIEPLAEAGGVCLSGQVFDQVRNKIDEPIVPLGPRELKNVRYPVDVYRIDLGGASTGPRAVANKHRLAVLPFLNMSPDPQDEFFSDGLTEEMIAELSKVPGLRVIARTSVMRFRGTTKSISEIGEALQVGTLLEGSARRAGNRVRVTAQLIDARSEEHLWSERYDRELDNIFEIQSEIAGKVAAALHVALPEVGIRPEATANPEAHRAYLMGRFLWAKRSPDALRSALRCFEDALRLDPDYAKAYCGVADCYAVLKDQGQEFGAEGMAKAIAAARRALELDDSLPEAHASLGLTLQHDYQWDAAEREFRRAIALNPSYAPAHHWSYMGLMAQGRIEEAVEELRRALDADPLSPNTIAHFGNLAWVQGRDAEAFAMWKRSAELGMVRDTLLTWQVALLVQTGRLEEAQMLFRTTRVDSSGFLGRAFPAMALGLLGMRDDALRELNALRKAAEESRAPAAHVAWVYGVLGMVDEFFEWAFRSVDEKGPSPYVIIVLPLFKELRRDGRFREYLGRLGLAR